MGILDKHSKIKRSATLLFVLSPRGHGGRHRRNCPLFYLENTIETLEGVRPFSPLELAGRDVYIREGCYTCHAQMNRPMRDEVER